ncbi:hypothetical protein CKO32_01185 [Afifella marina DSM 2698]|uniref:Uncharacterized protein n=2 Tax=Afifella marina TaxID=1080 RepID=A0A1G5MYA1_AFIMA|nr:hypothetical protein [Afifella marina DSM 2698]MBK1628295.1 hypothetical protein [Afifella marina]MBK5918954.1 hypothetical protein [Afifella marina]RAI20299.1 hypothetical protein CH311_10820 [Afifella marina DSM 2698]SCZ30073.1 hypothetical protein SAMN03080610_01203 [Afifella marina DSM 2698]
MSESDEKSFADYNRRRDVALEDVAQLAVNGNSYAREIAEKDDELKEITERVEKEQAGSGEPNTVAAREEPQPDDDRAADVQEREHEEIHELHEQVDTANRKADQARASTSRSSDQQTDPARQQVPRMNEMERRDDERDRDDFER